MSLGRESIELNFDGAWSEGTIAVRVDGGTGSLHINMPSDIGFQIQPSVRTGKNFGRR